MAWASLEGQVAECIDDFASGILASRRDGDQVASMKEHFLENMAVSALPVGRCRVGLLTHV